MASVTHQALLMVGTGVVAAVPKGWHQPLSSVAPRLAPSVRIVSLADASSYANNWLHPIAAVVTAIQFGWTNRLATVAPRTRDTRLIDPSSFANAWLSPATAKDPYFASVVLLMGFEDADASIGAPGMTDESTANNKGLAFNIADNAQIDTAQSKFGGSSLLLDGAGGDRIRFHDDADWNLAAGAFTIECWIRPNSVGAGTRFIVCQWQIAPNLGWVLYQSGARLSWNVSTTGSNNLNDIPASPPSMSVATWYAVCMEFDGTKYRMYLDGTMIASSTTLRTIFDSPNELSIGASNLGGSGFNGWIDEMRITKGVARYASDSGYTPATAAFPRS